MRLKTYFLGRVRYPTLILVVKNQFVGAHNMPSPTNHFLENKKKEKTQKQQNRKGKNIPANQPPPQAPLLSRYNFFSQNMHTCINLGSKRLPQASRIPSNYIVTCDAMGYAILLY